MLPVALHRGDDLCVYIPEDIPMPATLHWVQKLRGSGVFFLGIFLYHVTYLPDWMWAARREESSV